MRREALSIPLLLRLQQNSPPREEVNLQILELMKDFRVQMKASSPPEGVKSMTADEISALTQRGDSPLAGLEFKQTLPMVKGSDFDFDKNLDSYLFSQKLSKNV